MKRCYCNVLDGKLITTFRQRIPTEHVHETHWSATKIHRGHLWDQTQWCQHVKCSGTRLRLRCINKFEEAANMQTQCLTTYVRKTCFYCQCCVNALSKGSSTNNEAAGTYGYAQC